MFDSVVESSSVVSPSLFDGSVAASNSLLPSGLGDSGVRHSAQLPPSDVEFVQGINFGGGSVVIGGNRWDGFDSLNRGTISDFERVEGDWGIQPLQDDTSQMLGTGVRDGRESKDLDVSVPLQNGEYYVDVLVSAPSRTPSVFEIGLEGQALGAFSAAAGEIRLVRSSVSITDGRLEVLLDKHRKTPNLLGMQISRVSEETPVPGPVRPVPVLPSQGQGGSGRRNVGNGYEYGILARNADVADAQEAYGDWKDLYLTHKGVPNRSNMLRISHEVNGRGRSSGEFQGYGMLFAAHLESTDTVLEKLWNYTEHYLNGDGLMPWDISATGVVEGPGAALDGDMDIAISLDYAARRWPGRGWEQRAETYIDNMLKPAQRSHLRTDPLDTSGWPRYKQGEYLNYLATGYMERFSERTGDDRWVDITIPNSYELMAYSFDNFELPAWFVDGEGRSVRPPDPWNSKLNRHDAGAIRTDWRIATHYLSSGHRDAKKWSDKLSNFFEDAGQTTKFGRVDEFSPTNLRSGYRFATDRRYQAGEGYGTRSTAEGMITAAGVTAMASGDVEMTNTIYDFLAKDPIERDDRSMDNAMQVMGLLIMSGGLNAVK